MYTGSRRVKQMRKARKLKIAIYENGGERLVSVRGRDAWALKQLLDAGSKGCTPIDNPAPRWSHYIWKLRQAGIPVETVTENHGGEYPGHHAKYRLTVPVRIVKENGAVPDRQIAA